MDANARTNDDIARIDKINSILRRQFPEAKIALVYHDPWQLLVSVILSAQCTDVMVNIVTARLFLKYPDLQSYIDADRAAFEHDIRQTGFYHNKANNILKAAHIMKERFNGTVPRTMEDLLTIPGVARKTANVVLGNAYGVVEGIAVDTHVSRISQRLRFVPVYRIGGKDIRYVTHEDNQIIDFIKDADPVKIEQILMKMIPRGDWFSLTYRLIDFGRAICKAQNPHCGECPLNDLCPVSRVSSGTARVNAS